MRSLVVLATLCAIGCTRASGPNVDDALVACESLAAGVYSCNEELLVGAADGAVFGDQKAALAALIEAVRTGAVGSDVETSAGEIDIDGKMVAALRVEMSTEDVDYRGTAVAAAGKLSVCMVAVDIAVDPCPRIHAAVLAGGRALLDKRVAAAQALPLIAKPSAPKGCEVDDGERGEFRIDCADTAVIDVRFPEGGAAKALDDFAAEALDDGWDDGDTAQTVTAGTCTLLGQSAPCVTVAGSWTVRAAVAQTRQGRRLVECGTAGAREPKGELCPLVTTTASTRTVAKPPTTE
jgi:hypothetical protein